MAVAVGMFAGNMMSMDAHFLALRFCRALLNLISEFKLDKHEPVIELPNFPQRLSLLIELQNLKKYQLKDEYTNRSKNKC